MESMKGDGPDSEDADRVVAEYFVSLLEPKDAKC